MLELIVVIAIVSIVIAMTLAGVQRARASAARVACLNKLRQIGLAHQQYHSKEGTFPAGSSDRGPDEPFPFMSWEVRLLPFLEQGAAWDEIVSAYKADRNFLANPPHVWLTRPMAAFACPADARTAQPQATRGGKMRGLSSYLGVEGLSAFDKSGILFVNSAVRMSEITDGTSNTLLVGERPPSADMIFGWWYGGWGQDKDGEGDTVLGVRTKNKLSPYAPGCPIGPYHFGPGNFTNQCDAFHFWSPHSGGANFLFADGSARLLRYDSDPIIPSLSTRSGGEQVATLD